MYFSEIFCVYHQCFHCICVLIIITDISAMSACISLFEEKTAKWMYSTGKRSCLCSTFVVLNFKMALTSVLSQGGKCKSNIFSDFSFFFFPSWMVSEKIFFCFFKASCCMAASYGNVCAQSCFQECGISHERMPLKHHKERLCFLQHQKQYISSICWILPS